MSKIIIFKEIQEKALDNSLEDLVLFGEANFIKDKGKKYDLIFHAKQTYPYEIKKQVSLVIPVLRTFNDDEAINRISSLNSKYPEFTKYAVSSEFLDFYEVVKEEQGRKIIPLGKYKVVPKKKFLDFAKNPKLARSIQEKRRIIDKKY